MTSASIICHTPRVTDQPDRINVRAEWPTPDLRPQPVNQFLIQPGPPLGDGPGVPDGFYLLFGQLAPPVLLPGMSREQLLEATRAPLRIETQAYLFLTRERLAELHQALGKSLDELKEIEGGH